LNAGRRQAGTVAVSTTFIQLDSIPLHDRIVSGDREAFEAIAAWSVTQLHTRLGRRFPRASRDHVHDAIVDALLDYAAAPARFDRTRNISLQSFLYYASRKNLSNLLVAEGRRRTREAEYATTRPLVTADSMGVDAHGLRSSEARHRIEKVSSDDRERDMVRKWLSGERRTRELATVYGVSHLPPKEQQKEIKRVKDRILKRVKRHVDFFSTAEVEHRPAVRNLG
jgi:RNA polymerase sigma-70 factor, ECF subfamily